MYMNGYALGFGICHQCNSQFTFNPRLVPSLRLPNGQQVVFCRPCVEAANPQRVANGLVAIPTDGGYDACPEEELAS